MSSPDVKPVTEKNMHDREAVFYLVFESLFGIYSPREILDAAYAADNFNMNEDIEEKFLKIAEHGEELDGIIASASEKRKFARVPKISVAILRVALFEIIFDDKIHENISVSEAVRFAEDFASEQDVKFINGVLGGYLRAKKNAVLRS
ncbi:MAG: transcription antitermination protein NusB [Ruminococcus sp.]|jgi:N utilization substance protein B|nr:transcription antitermination protein NusB [Ruminococcus sp.]